MTGLLGRILKESVCDLQKDLMFEISFGAAGRFQHSFQGSLAVSLPLTPFSHRSGTFFTVNEPVLAHCY